MFPSRSINSFTNRKRNLISFTNPDSMIAEQFRTITANLHFLTGKRNKCVFLFTSPGTAEGKSTTVANIAVSLAQQKQKVLIIDGNLREPSLHSIFKTSNSVGLTDVLNGKAALEEAIYPTEIGRLDVLASGTITHNPTELLGSNLINDLLKEALKTFDIILIDSTGILEVADTKVLANKCDGVILVVSERTTSSAKALETKKALEFAEAKLIGVVLNEMK